MGQITEAGLAHMAQIQTDRDATYRQNLADRLAVDIGNLAPGWVVWESLPEGADHQRRGGTVVRVFPNPDTGFTDVTVVDTWRRGERWTFTTHHLVTADLAEARPLGSSGCNKAARTLFRCIGDRAGQFTDLDEHLLRWALTLRDTA